MSLNVEYGPIGLAGALAVKAGQNEAGYKAQQVAMEQQRLSMEQQAETTRQAAQDKAFSLQEAQASQIALAQRRTPAAEHIAGALSASNLTKQDEQRQSLAQLDDMLEKGQITSTQYQQARAGVMTGSKGLIDKAIMPPDQTDPMQKPLFQAKLRSIREQREAAYEELKQLNAAKLDPVKSDQVNPERIKTLQAQIDKTYADEQGILTEAAPKATAPESPGSSSMTPFKGWPSSGTTPAAAPAPTPSWSGHPDGTILTSPSTGKQFIMQNGQPVPYTLPAAPTAQPATTSIHPVSTAASVDTRSPQLQKSYPEGFRIHGEDFDQVMRDGRWVTVTKPEESDTPVWNTPSGPLEIQQ